MKLNELLGPCPFCGSEVEAASLEMDETGVRRITIDCRCGMSFDVASDDLIYANNKPYQLGKSAIEKWNERVIPERTEDSND